MSGPYARHRAVQLQALTLRTIADVLSLHADDGATRKSPHAFGWLDGWPSTDRAADSGTTAARDPCPTDHSIGIAGVPA
jgi:hypothetical protein